MKVIITKKHVEDHPDYSSPFNCPLYHALKEQHPELKFSGILGHGAIGFRGGLAIFIEKGKWNASLHFAMLGKPEMLYESERWNGEVPEQVELEYEYNYQYQQELTLLN